MTDIKSRQKARRLASERNLCALANDTKWHEFFLKVIEKKIQVEIKLLDGAEYFSCKVIWLPSQNYVEGGMMGPYLFSLVEQVVSSNVEELVSTAEAVGMEYDIESTKVIVYGYK